MSALVTYHRRDDGDGKLFGLAIVISILLHLGLYYVLPYLQSRAVQPIKRIVVELNMTEQQQAVAPPPAPPPPEQPKTEPTPQQVVKQVQPQKPIEKIIKKTPVLTTDAPAAPSDYVAPAAPAPVAATPTPVADSKPSNSTNTAASSSSTSTEQAPAAEASREETDSYGQSLYEMVGKNKNYPQIAIRRNWEGQVKVLAKFVLGKLVDVMLVDSSGHEALDKEALSMLRKAVSQLPVRGNLAGKTFTITVPVDFKLAEQ